MKKPYALLLAAGILLAAGALAATSTPESAKGVLDVSPADLTAAGYTGVTTVAPTATRFRLPVRYFRVDQSLNSSDAKKDCADCANLVAVYAATSSSIPGWALNQKAPYRIIGGRIQGRVYLRNQKDIIIVTGPDQKLVAALTDGLAKKFGR